METAKRPCIVHPLHATRFDSTLKNVDLLVVPVSELHRSANAISAEVSVETSAIALPNRIEYDTGHETAVDRTTKGGLARRWSPATPGRVGLDARVRRAGPSGQAPSCYAHMS